MSTRAAQGGREYLPRFMWATTVGLLVVPRRLGGQPTPRQHECEYCRLIGRSNFLYTQDKPLARECI